jgi:hypothetical protein
VKNISYIYKIIFTDSEVKGKGIYNGNDNLSFIIQLIMVFIMEMITSLL